MQGLAKGAMLLVDLFTITTYFSKVSKLDKLLNEYGESHKNETNKIIHWVCVPLIFFSIVALLWSIPADFLNDIFPYLNWATLSLTLTLIYYLTLSFPLFIGMLILVTFFSFIADFIDKTVNIPLWTLAVSIFIAAWIGQFFGHKLEGKKPSFFKDLQFLLIGPAWLMHFIYKELGLPYK